MQLSCYDAQMKTPEAYYADYADYRNMGVTFSALPVGNWRIAASEGKFSLSRVIVEKALLGDLEPLSGESEPCLLIALLLPL